MATGIRSLPRADLIDELPKSIDDLLVDHKLISDEYKEILNILGRSPTFAELGVFSAMWSEHCSYKSSRIHLKRFPTKGENVVQGPGENAGVVRLTRDLCIVFKMESHNHPSYIEPYQGAATGVGGILRDVFCMGARPIANLNCLRFGPPGTDRTSYLLENVVKGIGDYGNCVGIPTVGGQVRFDDAYRGNPLVNAMTVGLIRENKIFKGYAEGQGNLLVYFGSATGRDGIHGATMASDSFASSDQHSKTTIQVGDPFAEKLLLEATLELLSEDLVVGIQDMGAAGLTSSAFEMASRAGNGIYLDLDKVPVRAENMSAYELLLSESQERMLIVVEPDKWSKVQAILEKWDLKFDVVGKVTDTGVFQGVYQGKTEVEVPIGPLTDAAPLYDRPVSPGNLEALSSQSLEEKLEPLSSEDILKKIFFLSGSKKGIYEQYDYHIGNRTVLGPKEGGAAVMWLHSEGLDGEEEFMGVATAAGSNERYCSINPRLGAQHSVCAIARSLFAVGAQPLAITDCLNFGNPEDPEVMWQFSEAVDGISTACERLRSPVVSGNVSFYNETDGTSIKPTPMIGMVGKVRDVRNLPTSIVDEPCELFLLMSSKAKPFFSGSMIAAILLESKNFGDLPEVDWGVELEAARLIGYLLNEYRLGFKGVRDLSEGGLLAAVAKMQGSTLSSKVSQPKDIPDVDWLKLAKGAELAGAYVLGLQGLTSNQISSIESTFKDLRLFKLGEFYVGEGRQVVIDGSGFPYPSTNSYVDRCFRDQG